MANFTRFTTFPIFCHQSVSFLEKSQKFSFLCGGGGGVHLQIFLVFQLFQIIFTPKQLKMTHNGEYCQKSGLDWLQTANFGQFAGFSIFSPKMSLRLTKPISPDSQLFPSFATKCLIFGEISKIFILWGGGGVHWQSFLVFQLFQIISHQSSSK